jgi:hypothetical protein
MLYAMMDVGCITTACVVTQRARVSLHSLLYRASSNYLRRFGYFASTVVFSAAVLVGLLECLLSRLLLLVRTRLTSTLCAWSRLSCLSRRESAMTTT